MAKRVGLIARIFSNFRNSLFAAKQADICVGSDHLGNRYFEKSGDGKHNLRSSRYIEERRDISPFDVPEVPVEWEAWLRGRRKDPPTQEEIEKNYMKMMQTKHRASQLDNKFSKEPEPHFEATEKRITEDITNTSLKTPYPTYAEFESTPGEKYNKHGNKVK